MCMCMSFSYWSFSEKTHYLIKILQKKLNSLCVDEMPRGCSQDKQNIAFVYPVCIMKTYKRNFIKTDMKKRTRVDLDLKKMEIIFLI